MKLEQVSRRYRQGHYNRADDLECFILLFVDFEWLDYRFRILDSFDCCYQLHCHWNPSTTQTNHHDHYAQVHHSLNQPNCYHYLYSNYVHYLLLEIIFPPPNLYYVDQYPSKVHVIFIIIFIFDTQQHLWWMLLLYRHLDYYYHHHCYLDYKYHVDKPWVTTNPSKYQSNWK